MSHKESPLSLRLNAYSIPYQQTPLHYFARIENKHGAILLDSGSPSKEAGRYDIMSALPLAEVIVSRDGHASSDAYPELSTDPIQAQRELLSRLEVTINDDFPRHLPFQGGIMGAWSYEFGRLMEGLPTLNSDQLRISLPLARIGLYHWALIQDHHLKQSWIIADANTIDEVKPLFVENDSINESEFQLLGKFSPVCTRSEYQHAFERIKHYIRTGDCYQVNLTQAFKSPYEGNEWKAYVRMRQATPTPFGAFIRWENSHPACILSASPERFIQTQNGHVITQPIKGTRPRGNSPEEDTAFAQDLVNSTKDRAENIMIVDLLRNDIGRVCEPGSVQVTQLTECISYPNVHHLVSTIEGQLSPKKDPFDLLAATLPGGSITGAPKHRAMQIIDEVESSQRSYYCGSIGYIDHRGNMDTSITIRTAVLQEGNVMIWGGGGIVSDSEEADEYLESLVKIKRLMSSLTDEYSD